MTFDKLQIQHNDFNEFCLSSGAKGRVNRHGSLDLSAWLNKMLAEEKWHGLYRYVRGGELLLPKPCEACIFKYAQLQYETAKTGNFYGHIPICSVKFFLQVSRPPTEKINSFFHKFKKTNYYQLRCYSITSNVIQDTQQKEKKILFAKFETSLNCPSFVIFSAKFDMLIVLFL